MSASTHVDFQPTPMPAVAAQPLAVTPVQAAAMLGVQPRTLEIWRKEKRGPRYVRIGDKRSRILYKVADLEAYLNAHMVETGETGGE